MLTLASVKNLISHQFPQWQDLEITFVKNSGHDNQTFHLGQNMTIRLPRSAKYEPQIKKESIWLPVLAKHLSFHIPTPLGLGHPSVLYPSFWSVNQFISGETLTRKNVANLSLLALDLTKFLVELQKVPITTAPAAGDHNFFRGASPSVYHDEVINTFTTLQNDLPVKQLEKIWLNAITSSWEHEPVWLHGDIAPGNLIVQKGRLHGVIDFGIMAVGDPACDYAMAWSFFEKDSRSVFLANLDEELINRAKGWALWKALITYRNQNTKIAANAAYTLQQILLDSK